MVNADGSQPSPEVYVLGTVYTETGDYIGDFDAWEPSGFTLTGTNLPAGRFRLKVETIDQNTGETTTAWFDGATTEAAATLVPVAPGKSVAVTFHLP